MLTVPVNLIVASSYENGFGNPSIVNFEGRVNAIDARYNEFIQEYLQQYVVNHTPPMYMASVGAVVATVLGMLYSNLHLAVRDYQVIQPGHADLARILRRAIDCSDYFRVVIQRHRDTLDPEAAYNGLPGSVFNTRALELSGMLYMAFDQVCFYGRICLQQVNEFLHSNQWEIAVYVQNNPAQNEVNKDIYIYFHVLKL